MRQRSQKGFRCVQPDAPWTKCCVCEAWIKTCERKKPVGFDYTCPVHPDGAQLPSGDWTCSYECWEVATKKCIPEEVFNSVFCSDRIPKINLNES
ncbi:MAG: hypothetical protein A3B91_01745 [Candidatus Yanofskybacteria bacterium RIFCSPHIGHO2_02_FULL_41_29]|uniref:Uncharacterized protein n=1 Tax=Candidatus Yanofskybacteria bacterium RIFCSPHIGHO2_01_FULL_41_53 TaxID=1802663 RepID=A0A1F8EI98_9BACT|nr:MAG: hypothetical protein A2650_03175 [Candidatus Yanofskybacteria bacterium RIFCSPHIGHO2_01_FULL_41_53]OGN11847.1 MAG: hypothetical protein A3B91_01745 [Candidatus Yanofskybacteria bacterium RIFCSPHIGHO2_02_FULL_41_29]OGN23095.1 MAG: hypothetical protein A2916_05095 [Candidatus Yanofskybacteria bacterium RIFCSPLOWO2_01_FULL_41_67]OGN29898.1 MAG: hypothetical protein A3H54_03850 [Candidatus Yanofskybacteria bacterium RIFCSPLOWO2_02_FULL_41_13]